MNAELGKLHVVEDASGSITESERTSKLKTILEAFKRYRGNRSREIRSQRFSKFRKTIVESIYSFKNGTYQNSIEES